MAGGVPAGRLSIEIVAEIARLQQDLDKAKRAVGAASGDIAKSARAANDNLAAIGKGAGAGVQSFTRDVAALKAQLDPAWRAQQRYNEQLEIGMRAFKQGAIDRQQFIGHMRTINAELKGIQAPIGAIPPAFNNVSKSIKLTARDGLNLSRQFSDIGVTAAMGMSPLMIAIQQGPQLLDIFQEKAISTGATIGTVAKAAAAQIWTAVAPLAPLIAGIALAAGTIAAGFALGAREINKASGDISKSMGLTEKQLERVKKAGVETSVTIGDTFFAFFDVVGDRLYDAFEGPLKWLKDAWNATLDFIVQYGGKAIKFIVGGFVGGVRAIVATWKQLPAAIADVIAMAGNKAIDGFEWIIRKHIAGINWLITQANAILGTSFATFDENITLGRNKVTGAAADFAATFRAEFMSGIQDTGAAMGSFWDDVGKRARGRREQAIREAAGDAEKARKAAGGSSKKTAADPFGDIAGSVERDIAALKAQAQALGMAEEAGMLLTNQQKLMNDAQAKGITLTDGQRATLMDLARQLTDAQIALRDATVFQEIKDEALAFGRSIDQAQARVGVYSQALDELTFYQELLNKQTDNGKRTIDAETDARLRQIAAIKAGGKAALDAAEFMEAQRKAHADQLFNLHREAGELGLTGAALATYRKETELLVAARQAGLDQDPAVLAAIKRQAAEFGELSNKIAQAAENLAALNGGMSNLGGPLGQIMGVLTSNNPTAALLGMGGFGSLLGMMTKGGQAALTKQRDAMQMALERVLGVKSSNIASSLADMLQGAGIGSTVAGVVGNGSTGSQIGGALGGAAGNVLFGPVGSIIGGVLGSVVGGLFKQSKSKANVITNGSLTGTFGGTGGDYTRAADSLSQSVLSSLDKIAQALGVAADGAFKLSIGMRDGNFVVNPTGGGTKASMGAVNFGKDEAAAIAFAIQDAISDGVFKGLGAGIERLLKAGGDLETQLQKALSFKGVFDELRQLKDPQGAALDDLAKWHTNMAAIFAEAGATSEELAQLEELTGLKRAEIVKKYADYMTEAEEAAKRKAEETARIQIEMLSAVGLTEKATAIARAQAIQDVEESLRPLQQFAWAVEDSTAGLSATIRKFQDFSASLRDFRNDLIGSNGSMVESYRTAQVKFLTTSALAATGDEQGLADLQKASRAFLDASKAQSSTAAQYQRDYAAVLRALDTGIDASDNQVDAAQQQLQAAQDAVSELVALNDTAAGIEAVLAAMTSALNELKKATKDAQAADRSQRVTIVADETV